MANKNQKGTPWAVLLGVAAVISFQYDFGQNLTIAAAWQGFAGG